MSSPHSGSLRRRSCGGACDLANAVEQPSEPLDADIFALAELMSSRGQFGVAWLDADLVVTRAYGAIAANVVVGEPISLSVLALIGQEDRIAALMHASPPQLTVPNVAVMDGDGAPVRLTVNVLYAKSTGFVVLFTRVMTSSLADLMVEDEIRKRRIADAELARINRQLEEFAYVISHDLKAPLRALRYYSSDIGEALGCEPADVAAAQRAADNITAATKRMSNMLVGLLEYSRIGRQDETIAIVDTEALARDIADNLALPKGMTLKLAGPWPTVRTTPVPLDLVLRNLIDNAVKHHDRETGVVRVSTEESAAAIVFDVSDDGPGIPTEWHDAIFQPFSRVDDQKNPESSGIGLALVKRTVESAGGRIEVRSDPARARGTTFRVTWPKR
jgi:signal transduction histidine kinase